MARYKEKLSKDLEELRCKFDSLVEEWEWCKELEEKLNSSRQQLREYKREMSEM